MPCSDLVFVLERTHTTGDLHEMKEIYGNDALSYDLVKCYHHEFNPGLISRETAPRPGNPHLALMRHLLVEFRLPFSMIDM